MEHNLSDIFNLGQSAAVSPSFSMCRLHLLALPAFSWQLEACFETPSSLTLSHWLRNLHSVFVYFRVYASVTCFQSQVLKYYHKNISNFLMMMTKGCITRQGYLEKKKSSLIPGIVKSTEKFSGTCANPHFYLSKSCSWLISWASRHC